jgi:hypothetical protein
MQIIIVDAVTKLPKKFIEFPKAVFPTAETAVTAYEKLTRQPYPADGPVYEYTPPSGVFARWVIPTGNAGG